MSSTDPVPPKHILVGVGRTLGLCYSWLAQCEESAVRPDNFDSLVVLDCSALGPYGFYLLGSDNLEVLENHKEHVLSLSPDAELPFGLMVIENIDPSVLRAWFSLDRPDFQGENLIYAETVDPVQAFKYAQALTTLGCKILEIRLQRSWTPLVRVIAEGQLSKEQINSLKPVQLLQIGNSPALQAWLSPRG